jgi:hypothetical protein
MTKYLIFSFLLVVLFGCSGSDEESKESRNLNHSFNFRTELREFEEKFEFFVDNILQYELEIETARTNRLPKYLPITIPDDYENYDIEELKKQEINRSKKEAAIAEKFYPDAIDFLDSVITATEYQAIRDLAYSRKIIFADIIRPEGYQEIMLDAFDSIKAFDDRGWRAFRRVAFLREVVEKPYLYYPKILEKIENSKDTIAIERNIQIFFLRILRLHGDDFRYVIFLNRLKNHERFTGTVMDYHLHEELAKLYFLNTNITKYPTLFFTDVDGYTFSRKSLQGKIVNFFRVDSLNHLHLDEYRWINDSIFDGRLKIFFFFKNKDAIPDNKLNNVHYFIENEDILEKLFKIKRIDRKTRLRDDYYTGGASLDPRMNYIKGLYYCKIKKRNIPKLKFKLGMEMNEQEWNEFIEWYMY